MIDKNLEQTIYLHSYNILFYLWKEIPAYLRNIYSCFNQRFELSKN